MASLPFLFASNSSVWEFGCGPMLCLGQWLWISLEPPLLMWLVLRIKVYLLSEGKHLSSQWTQLKLWSGIHISSSFLGSQRHNLLLADIFWSALSPCYSGTLDPIIILSLGCCYSKVLSYLDPVPPSFLLQSTSLPIKCSLLSTRPHALCSFIALAHVFLPSVLCHLLLLLIAQCLIFKKSSRDRLCLVHLVAGVPTAQFIDQDIGPFSYGQSRGSKISAWDVRRESLKKELWVWNWVH